MGKITDEFDIPINQPSIGNCIYCKLDIYEDHAYVVNEEKYLLHIECYKLLEDNSDYFAR